MLTGLRVFVSARVVEPGEVIVVPVADLRRVLATQPGLGDTILAAFMARRAALLSGASAAIRVVGSRFSPDSQRMREFLARIRIPHEWLDPDHDAAVDRLLREVGVTPAELPVVIVSGSVLRRPTPGELAEYLGLTVGSLPDRCFDLVIVGGGPAGLAAAVYGASEGLRTLGVDMVAPGGQAGTSSRIENYLGFPTGISGGDLTQRALVQAEKFGAHLTAPCAATSLREQAGHLVVGLADGTEVAGRAVIVATGARYRRLDVDRLADFESKGVYYAATTIEARECARVPRRGRRRRQLGGPGRGVPRRVGQPGHRRHPRARPEREHVPLPRRPASRRTSGSTYEPTRRSPVSTATRRSARSVWPARTATRRCRASRCSPSSAPTRPRTGCRDARPSTNAVSCSPTDPSSDEHLDEPMGRCSDRRPLPFETSHPGLFAVGDVRAGSTKRVAAAVGEGSAAVRSVHEYLAFAH